MSKPGNLHQCLKDSVKSKVTRSAKKTPSNPKTLRLPNVQGEMEDGGATVTVAGQVLYNTENILQEALHMNNAKDSSGAMRGKKDNLNGFFHWQVLGVIPKDFTLTNWLHLKA